MINPLLSTTELSHSYGSFRALAPTSIDLFPGDAVVISGPNGSGKTTFLLCLSGLLRPTTGQVRVCGHDLYQSEVEAKRQLAFVPDVPRFYTELTAWEHLRFQALAFGVADTFEEQAARLLHDFGLWEGRDLYPHNYSRGMRLKLGLVMALIRPFKVLLLDEPTSALDFEGAELIRRQVNILRNSGAVVLISSHDPSIAEQTGSRVWRMRQGILEVPS